MINTIKAIAGVSALVLITACGCGSSNSVANADPQGIWTGPTSSGYTASTVILETGETWGIYSAGNTIYGAL